MTSSVAPYEQLVRQVEALKAENSHLRQELRDNSSHLSKLETETSGMKVSVGLGRGLGLPLQGQTPPGCWTQRPTGQPRAAGSRCRTPSPAPTLGGPEALTRQAGAGGRSAGVLGADGGAGTAER